MSVYSWILTLVALIVVPIQVAITLAGVLFLGGNLGIQRKRMPKLSLT